MGGGGVFRVWMHASVNTSPAILLQNKHMKSQMQAPDSTLPMRMLVDNIIELGTTNAALIQLASTKS